MNEIPMTLSVRIASITRVVLLGILSILAACSGVPNQVVRGEMATLVWPHPPDLPRITFETVLRSPADIAVPELTADRLVRELSGALPISSRPVFEKPMDVVARHGRIYVTDTSTQSIVVFDVPRRRLFRFGYREPNVLRKPVGLALDAQMNVYVADSKRRQIMVFDSLGLFLRTIGGPDDLVRPTGVGVSRDGERIYVVDRSDNESEGHCVVVYSRDGLKLRVIGTRGSGDGEFNVPLQTAVALDGTVYVLDSGNFRVQAFDRDGTFLRAFGSPGVNPGNFARPRGIGVDDLGNVYVTDASFNNFQIFNANGELLLAVGQSAVASAPAKYGLLSGIAIDETGRIYVVDQLFNKVEVFRRLSEKEGQRMLLR